MFNFSVVQILGLASLKDLTRKEAQVERQQTQAALVG
jgi:hypothetical protein